MDHARRHPRLHRLRRDRRSDRACVPALLDSLDTGESTRVDMRAVSFFGVAGVRALLAARDFADRRHCAMCIDGSYCVTRVLEVVGLAAEFDICEQRRPADVRKR
ncbi:STAS domain-containing protein [Nocardia sp. NPDC051981]|uniref:STAS domain-containing protein n=1 Tax=Nocardia sp. NPDC051981 TaxID=3155417 RepID=UPI0034298801